MPKTDLFDMTAAKVGEIDLADAVFGCEVNGAVLHTVVKNYLANQRQGTQSTLTRSEVAGGKALQTEGYRTCKTGLHQSSSACRRRRCIGTEAQRLQIFY